MSETRVELELRGLGTEQARPELAELDLLPVDELVSLMCADARRVPDALEPARAAIARAVEALAAGLERGGRLIYVGAGTAGRLGMLDAAEAGPTFNVPPGQVIALLAGGAGALDAAIENAEDDREGGAAAISALSVGAADVVVGISASGRTPYVLGAISAAGRAGALTVALVCNAGSPLAAEAQIAIEVLVGAELVAGSTRLNAGTAQKIVLNILSTAAMIQLGKTYGGLMVDLRATNAKLRDRATRIVAEIAAVTPAEARDALERCGWQPKLAACVLAGDLDPGEAAGLLERHRGHLRPALEELAPAPAARPGAPGIGPQSRRLGVAAAFVAGALVPGDVSVSGERIAAIGLPGAGSGLAIPGLLDTQVNGYAGVDVLGADLDALAALGECLRRDGVAAYCPTLISSAEGELLAALARLAAARERPGRGAAILGVHLEGPFLSPRRAGAHPPEHLRAPDPRLLERLLDAGPVCMVTLAPELPGALELIEICVARGIVVSLGHSEASAEEAAAGFAAGATAVTHLFNAMPPLGARVPGLAGAALAAPSAAVQLIADGVHVSDELIRIAFAAAPGRCSLVSDAIAAAGQGDGVYALGGVEVEVRDGAARRADGTLAGSASRLVDGLARLGRLGIEPGAAIAAVSEQPGRLLGRAGTARLEPGGRADLLVLDDELGVQRILAAGRELYPVAPGR